MQDAFSTATTADSYRMNDIKNNTVAIATLYQNAHKTNNS